MTRYALLLLLAVPLAAQTRAVTAFVGVQGGGEVVIDDRKHSLDPTAAYGVMLSFDRGAGRILDVLASRYDTQAGPGDVTIDTLQVGGRYLLRRDTRTKPYIAATLGGTRFNTGEVHVVAVSFAGGGGAEVRLTRSLAVIFDGRLYTSLFGDDGEFECRNNPITCVTGVEGTTFQQFVASAGLTYRF